MALFYFNAKLLSRSAGHNAVAAAAYRSGSELVDERTGLVHDYTRKGGVVSAEIIAQAKSEKVIVFKKRRRHNYRRKNGHRQQMTLLRILAVGGAAPAKKAAAKKAAPEAAAAAE